MKLINTGAGMNIVMLPSGAQAFFYMSEPVACKTEQGFWYRIHNTKSMILEGHLANYLRTQMDSINWVTQKEINELVEEM